MIFADPGLNSLLVDWGNSGELRTRAEAHNIVFEERLGRNRLDAFEAFLSDSCADYEELKRQLSEFVTTYMEVGEPRMPPTFTNENVGAGMTEPSPEQKLIRVENLTRPLENAGLTLAELQRCVASTDPAEMALVDDFVNQWNRDRDNRPAFAAFKDQLLAEVCDADWPHRLRDRLGLTHLAPAGGTLAVAVMEYTVEDVLDEAAGSSDIVYPFCTPTFLDIRPSSQFFPTPKELSAGAPMALFEIWSDEDLIAEVIHPRLTYRPHHIAKLGEISFGVPATDFGTMRNNHLAALQLAAVRDDFGEEI